VAGAVRASRSPSHRSRRLRAPANAVLEEIDELSRIAGGRKAGFGRSKTDGRGAVSGGRWGRVSFSASGEMELRSFRGDPEDGFAEAEDAVRRRLRGLGAAGSFESPVMTTCRG